MKVGFLWDLLRWVSEGLGRTNRMPISLLSVGVGSPILKKMPWDDDKLFDFEVH